MKHKTNTVELFFFAVFIGACINIGDFRRICYFSFVAVVYGKSSFFPFISQLEIFYSFIFYKCYLYCLNILLSLGKFLQEKSNSSSQTVHIMLQGKSNHTQKVLTISLNSSLQWQNVMKSFFRCLANFLYSSLNLFHLLAALLLPVTFRT